MAVYFVLGSILVAWGLGLAVLGLLREDFPPGGAAGRALVGVTVVIVAGTLAALLATTKREHPREEAAAEAAALKKEQHKKSGAPSTAPAKTTPSAPAPAPPAPKPSKPSAKTVQVTEKEFSIALQGSKSLKAGSYTFDVLNQGKIQHDLTIDGDGLKDKKTKLINGGQSAKLSAKLKPANYTFYCSVPGHEQAGMKVNVTVVK
jgi:plastocyanin